MLTNEGFKRKAYVEYVDEMQAQAKEQFGADVNLSDRSPLGQWIKLVALARAEESEKAEAVYNSAFIDDAEGVSLDKAVKYKSISRFEALVATGLIAFDVTDNTTIPVGTLVSTSNGIQFKTTIETASVGGVMAYVPIVAVEYGSISNLPVGSITTLLTPIPGVSNTVYQEQPTTGGRNRETDTELRNRYHATNGEGSTTDGIASRLINTVSGVTAAYVIANNTNATDGSGRPANSIETYVLGGTAADIGLAIFKSKAAGIQTYGTQSVTVKDLANQNQVVKFSYATQKNIWVKLSITKNASYPSDAETTIKNATLNYINGLTMGQSVSASKMVSFAYKVDGVDDVTALLSTNGSTWAATGITQLITEVARTSLDKLVIEYV